MECRREKICRVKINPCCGQLNCRKGTCEDSGRNSFVVRKIPGRSLVQKWQLKRKKIHLLRLSERGSHFLSSGQRGSLQLDEKQPQAQRNLFFFREQIDWKFAAQIRHFARQSRWNPSFDSWRRSNAHRWGKPLGRLVQESCHEHEKRAEQGTSQRICREASERGKVGERGRNPNRFYEQWICRWQRENQGQGTLHSDWHFRKDVHPVQVGEGLSILFR